MINCLNKHYSLTFYLVAFNRKWERREAKKKIKIKIKIKIDGIINYKIIEII